MISGYIRELQTAIGEERTAFFDQLNELLTNEKTYAQIKSAVASERIAFFEQLTELLDKERLELQSFAEKKTVHIEGTAKLGKPIMNNLRW